MLSRKSVPHLSLLLTGLVAMLADCGGKAVVDPASGGSGQGGEGEIVTVASSSTGDSPTSSTSSSSSVSSSSSSSSSSSTGGAPPIPPLVENDLGNIQAGDPFTFEVPPNALGLTVYGHAPDIFTSLGVRTIVAPDNQTLVQNYTVVGTSKTYEWFGIATAGVPNTDDPQAMPLMPGTWSFTIDSFEPVSTVPTKVWYRQTVDGQFHGGVIDVNVFRVSGVASDSYLTQMVIDGLDGLGGLGIGTINIFPLANGFSTVTENNVYDLYQETAGAPGKPAVNVMAVNFIDLQGSQPLGFSPGAPGNALENGDMQSAVTMLIIGNLPEDAYTLRHEVGHFAGLSHTSEIAIGEHDKLSDTPECADVDQLLGNCPDFNNLMFPYANPFGPGNLSPKQDIIVQGSPIYRGAVEAGGGFAPPLVQPMGKWASAPPSNVQAQATLAQAATQPLAASRFGHHGLDDETAELLGAFWCGTPLGAVSPMELVVDRNPDPAALMAVGLDPLLRVTVRQRALAALGRLNPSGPLLTQLEAIAADIQAPRLVRMGAIEALADAAPSRLYALDLTRDPDAAVAIVASRR